LLFAAVGLTLPAMLACLIVFLRLAPIIAACSYIFNCKLNLSSKEGAILHFTNISNIVYSL